MRVALIALVLVAWPAAARAECSDLDRSADPCSQVGASPALSISGPWYRGPAGKRRVTNLAITVGAAGFFVATQVLESHLAAVDCRWCSVDSLDARIRGSLVWTDTSPARTISNITGYVVIPAVGIGLVLLGSSDTTSARLIDDTLPILETAALGEAFVQVVKFVAGRQRPFVHYDAPAPHQPEDNVSFFSAHTTLVFGLATSAAMVAHHRGYKTEPLIWSLGLALAATTAYLRIAGDEHYFTDVLTGTAAGVAAGLTVPLLSRVDTRVVLVGDGAAIAGTW